VKDKVTWILGPGLGLAWFLLIVLNFFDVSLGTETWWTMAAISLVAAIYYTVDQGMTVYVVKRLGEALITIWFIATMTFMLLRVLPGGPFDTEKAMLPEIKAAIERKYKLDAPLFEQYLNYLGNLAQGDLGQSYKYLGRNITEILAESLPASVQLGVYSLLLSYIIGIPFGVLAARFHNRWPDHLMMAMAISGVSLPSFLVAPILILLFCFGLGWFEPALWQGPAYYVLPTIVLGTRSAAVIARLVRASVLEVIRSDYIRTGRAKGLSERVLLFKHVLRNSLIPVLTFSGPLVAGIITGSFVVEQIFAVPGIGKHMVLSVSNRDYPLILGTTLVFSAILVICNLVVDLLYAYVDPRIKLS
jgi:oligopeptide transport system permease protein